MGKCFRKTQWRMQPIVPYSMLHLLIVGIVLICAVSFAIVLYKKQVKKKCVLLISSIILMIMEVYKQCFTTMIMGGNYSWSDFPFQLCSIPMYLGVCYPLLKRQQQKTIENFLMIFGLLGGVAAFIEPTSSFTSYWILTIHSVIWHGWLICLSLFLFLNMEKENRNFWPVALLYFVLAIIAVMWNTLFFQISQGTCNMFFLGPAKPDMYILDTIWEQAGWFLETVFMIGITELGAWGLFYLMILLKKKI